MEPTLAALLHGQGCHLAQRNSPTVAFSQVLTQQVIICATCLR